MAVRTLKLTASYDGTAYGGWQRQDNSDTIQARLEAALAEVEGRRVTVHGAGRTDAGVHALGQVASFTLVHPIETPTLVRALNSKLPSDIRVLSVVEVDQTFHAQYAAKNKRYRYRIDHAAIASPLECRYAWHVPEALDIHRMAAAGATLVGRHDFAAFQTGASEAGVLSTVRTIFDLRVTEESERLVEVEVEGSGFLRYMVRTIVGTLVEVGMGRRAADDMAAVLASQTRSRAGPTAPAHGLFLVHVDYQDA